MRDRMPFERGDDIEMFLQNCDLGPLGNVWRALGLEDPNLVISWTHCDH